VSLLQALAILAAGGAAGAINAVVGSGTLITFPVLLAFGYAPVVANVSNTIGLVPGSVAGAVGYRRELRGQGARIRTLACATAAGAATGATLLLTLPASAFKAIVPVFIAAALVLIIAAPRLGELLRRRRGHAQARIRPATLAAVFVTGVYGGYFGAAQGIMLLAILGLALDDSLQRINAAKNILAAGQAVTACGAHVSHSGTSGVRSAVKQEPRPVRTGIPVLQLQGEE